MDSPSESIHTAAVNPPIPDLTMRIEIFELGFRRTRSGAYGAGGAPFSWLKNKSSDDVWFFGISIVLLACTKQKQCSSEFLNDVLRF